MAEDNFTECRYEDLSPEDRALVDAAAAVMERAYNPYSRFSVGSALRTVEGEIIAGTNVENGAYGDTICAERAAIVRANAEGKDAFSKIAVIGSRDSITTPCGSCRQVIMEFARKNDIDVEVIMTDQNRENILKGSIHALLPHS